MSNYLRMPASPSFFTSFLTFCLLPHQLLLCRAGCCQWPMTLNYVHEQKMSAAYHSPWTTHHHSINHSIALSSTSITDHHYHSSLSLMLIFTGTANCHVAILYFGLQTIAPTLLIIYLKHHPLSLNTTNYNHHLSPPPLPLTHEFSLPSSSVLEEVVGHGHPPTIVHITSSWWLVVCRSVGDI